MYQNSADIMSGSKSSIFLCSTDLPLPNFHTAHSTNAIPDIDLNEDSFFFLQQLQTKIW